MSPFILDNRKKNMSMKILSITIILFMTKIVRTTIDLNLEELNYLANHLHPEECRKLVAAAHFKTYDQPKALNEAELKISKDIPCIELLRHWNSEKGEGKGETHEVLEHRLRQMGKYDLADWLGKTVFRELGQDLDKSLKEGFKVFANDTVVTLNQPELPLVPLDEDEELLNWYTFDSLCYFLLTLILGTILFVCCKIILRKYKQKKTRKRNIESYELIRLETSSSESEDMFDVRKLPSKKP